VKPGVLKTRRLRFGGAGAALEWGALAENLARPEGYDSAPDGTNQDKPDLQPTGPALGEQCAPGQSSPVEQAVLVMDDVVDAVSRHEVTGLVSDISQGLPLLHPR